MTFAKAFGRHVDCPPEVVEGETVREALDAYFERHPQVRGYVVDERSAVRRHVAVFLADTQIGDRNGLSDPVGADDDVYVFQALSGG